MKLFKDILPGSDPAPVNAEAAAQTGPVLVKADPFEATLEPTIFAAGRKGSLQAAVDTRIDNTVAICAGAATRTDANEPPVEGGTIDKDSPGTAEMASVNSPGTDVQPNLSKDDPMQVEEAHEVPIWELPTHTDPDMPSVKADDDALLSEMAIAALQAIEDRRNSENSAVAQHSDTGAPTGGRAKTRLLGFHRALESETDVFAQKSEAAVQKMPDFPVGWLVVVEGPGRGAQFTLCDCVAKIGRGEDQAVRLDFGDSSISRDNHAAIAYDEEQNKFFLGHGGKANLVRLNGNPVLSTEEMSDGDTIRIGETTMRFVSFCNPDFAWCMSDEDGAARD